jgi:hypothetical protein
LWIGAHFEGPSSKEESRAQERKKEGLVKRKDNSSDRKDATEKKQEGPLKKKDKTSKRKEEIVVHDEEDCFADFEEKEDSNKEDDIEIIPNEVSPAKKRKLEEDASVSFTSDAPEWDTPITPIHQIKKQAKFPAFEDSPDIVTTFEHLRSPVKPSTPIRKHSEEEDIVIPKMFPDPGMSSINIIMPLIPKQLLGAFKLF